MTSPTPLGRTAFLKASLKGSILVVDDEEPNRTLLRDLLSAGDCEVREAENGVQALQMVAAKEPDTVLLDVMMPGMDGFEVCRRLKNDPRTAPIPVLMVTALSDRPERLAGVHAGANDFLTKPVDTQDLLLRVRNALYTKNLYDKLREEQRRSEELLFNLLPPAIAARMKQGETTIADRYAEATVLVADLVGFATLMAQISPREVVFLINEIFSAFDALVDELGLEKIKTTGDSYIVAGGVNAVQPEAAASVAQLAVQMHSAVAGFNRQYNTSMRIRVGISTGPLISGVIGQKRLAYDIWGDAVNLAARLQTVAEPGRILVDELTFERLENSVPASAPVTFNLENGNTIAVRSIRPLCDDRGDERESAGIDRIFDASASRA